jgi:hypothetical protein
MRFSFPATPRQKLMMESQAKILHIACGTKTGKTMGLLAWLVEGLLKGEACSYVGPWFFRSQRSFTETKNLLAPWIKARSVRANEARLQITSAAGGYLDFTSGDNPMGAFGGNYDRTVLDEASRMSKEIFPAALTTISATNGKLRLASNVELGSKNWAIANFLRVQRMSPEERAKTGEDCLTFPTGGDGLVSPEVIELMKTQMPLPLYEALYLGKVPDSDCSLFRNLDRIFTGMERETPAEGVRYFLGVDLARKSDFTSATVIDSDGNVVAMERFSLLDWSLQVQKVALLYRTFKCVKCVADSTGLGDPVCEQLEGLGLEVERYQITVPSRKALLEELILSCDNREFTVPQTEKFKVYRSELESFEYVLDGTTAKYMAPGHDDTTFSLALAVHAYRSARGLVLGMLDFLKRRAKEIAEGVRDLYGELIHPEPKPAPVPVPVRVQKETRVEGKVRWQEKVPPCPACKSECTAWHADGRGGLMVHCRQCGRDDGKDPGPNLADTCPVPDCGIKLQTRGGNRWCQNHGIFPEHRPEDPVPPPGVSRRAHFSRLGSYALRTPRGRF